KNQIEQIFNEHAHTNHKYIPSKNPRTIAKILINEKNNTLKTIKNFHKPVLIIHNTEDQVIPYHLKKKIYDAANEPKEIFTIKKPHMRGPEFYGKEISDKIIKMIP